MHLDWFYHAEIPLISLVDWLFWSYITKYTVFYNSTKATGGHFEFDPMSHNVEYLKFWGNKIYIQSYINVKPFALSIFHGINVFYKVPF